MQRFLVIAALCWSAFATASDPKVLVVHSYHQGFFWTDSIQRGIEQQLGDRALDMRVLYLDSKRNQSEQFFCATKILVSYEITQRAIRCHFSER